MTITMTWKVNTKGLEELIKNNPEKADRAVRATGFYVEAIAKSLSPVMTGANRASIFTKTSKGIRGQPGNAGDFTPDVQMGEVIVAPSMVYSARLEFGFSGKDSLGRTYSQAAQPYLTPAAEQAPQFLERTLREEFNESS